MPDAEKQSLGHIWNYLHELLTRTGSYSLIVTYSPTLIRGWTEEERKDWFEPREDNA